jgi:hypothetical protein
MMLRIRFDGNIPTPTLSFLDTTCPGQCNSSYAKIPEGIEVVFCSAYSNFKQEHFTELKKIGQLASPHNEFIYDLHLQHNYQILYKDQVVLSLIQLRGWNTIEP